MSDGPIANDSLRLALVPPATADFDVIQRFALTFDGYAQWGSFERCAEIANARHPRDLTELRTCLFFEHRRWHHQGQGPDDEQMGYTRWLVQRIRESIAAGPSTLGDRGGPGLIDLLLRHGGDPAADSELRQALHTNERGVLASAAGGDVRQVGVAEAAARADPAAAFTFTAGAATLTAAGRTWQAGVFDPIAVGALRSHAAQARAASLKRGRVRLWAIDGNSPVTDIGSLQAEACGDVAFQVASQFNCLEAPGPFVTPVQRYLNDPTQGPRASISALPGTLLRHYAAPGAYGKRFVQTNDGPQIELLGAVCDPGVARVQNGYLLAQNIIDPKALLSALESRFDAIRVGAHHDVEVVLGYDWSGAVAGPPHPTVTQVFTSTVAGGGYGSVSGTLQGICQQLLRAGYLGTLLAAANLGCRRVVLTLIGGGAFDNPIRLIWEAIIWALDQVQPLASRDLDVFINGRDLGKRMDRNTLLAAIRARGGVLLECPRSGPAAMTR